jgi:apolipoprotein N-acyltransferase
MFFREGSVLRKQVFLLAAGVLLYTLAFPPADLGFLGFAAIVPFVLARHGATGWKTMTAFWLAAVSVFMIGCFWLSEPALINLVAMALPAGLYFVLFAFFYRANTARGLLPVWLAVPLAWISAEYIRTGFPLDGFPWLLLGYSAWRIPPLLQTADLFGVWGPGFLMALCSGVIADVVLQRRGVVAHRQGWRGVRFGVCLFLVLGVAALGYGLLRPASIELKKGPVLAAVQGNIPQRLKDNRNSRDDVIRIYRETTENFLQSWRGPAPDLVVWPETVFLFPVSDGRKGEIWVPAENVGDREARDLEQRKLIDPIIRGVVGARGSWFLVGALSYRLGGEGVVEKRNSVFLYDPEGTRCSSYSKTILVPGGEYLPWIDHLPFGDEIREFIISLAGYPPDLVPGDGPGLHTLRSGGREYLFGVQICYENIYGEYCSRFVRKGAQFMVNISNEGWFNESVEFDQMMAMSLFRAVETRRTLFRSTNTGISCVIDPLGTLPGKGEKVTWKGKDRAVCGVLAHEVPLCETTTVYTLWGDAFPRVICLLQILLIIAALFRGRGVTKRV